MSLDKKESMRILHTVRMKVDFGLGEPRIQGREWIHRVSKGYDLIAKVLAFFQGEVVAS